MWANCVPAVLKSDFAEVVSTDMPESRIMPRVLRAYRYLYYRNLTFYRRNWPGDLPQFNALFIVSFLLFLNLFSLAGLIDIAMGQRLFKNAVVGNMIWATLLLGAFLVSYGLLVQDHKDKKILKEFASETPDQRRKRCKAIVIYVLVTFAMLFAIVTIKNLR